EVRAGGQQRLGGLALLLLGERPLDDDRLVVLVVQVPARVGAGRELREERGGLLVTELSDDEAEVGALRPERLRPLHVVLREVGLGGGLDGTSGERGGGDDGKRQDQL